MSGPGHYWPDPSEGMDKGDRYFDPGPIGFVLAEMQVNLEVPHKYF